MLTEALRVVPGIEVVATASDGLLALAKIKIHKPDLLTLDLEMPKLDGLGVLRELEHESTSPGVIMLSAFTSDGAKNTTEALKLGAFDFVLKPSGSNIVENGTKIQKELAKKVSAFRQSRRFDQPQEKTPADRTVPSKSPRDDRFDLTAKIPSSQRPQAITIGISTGGPTALTKLLPKLPADLPVPILIVQHMPPMFTKSLADDLDRQCQVSVCEAEDGQLVEPGRVYIAPGGRQMKVERRNHRVFIVVNDDPAENSCRPAVDLFYSARSLTSTVQPPWASS